MEQRENTAAEREVREKFARITRMLIEKKRTVTTMESCTGGMLASLLTDTEGSSVTIKGAFVTYSNEAKLLQGVPAEVIGRFGIYSKQTAAAMAEACRRAYAADYGIGVTGSFGNADPENPDSVPGEVYFALSYAGGTVVRALSIPAQPSRAAYKYYTADRIADCLAALIEKEG